MMKTRLLVVIAAALVSGCGTARNDGLPRSYDFGIDAPAAQLPAVRVGQVRAVAPFDSVEMHYRLAFRNPAELLAFAQSRWAATPAELYRKRLLRAAAAGAGRCVLEVELHEVTQVFGARDASEALLELRARLSDGNSPLAERMFRIVQSGAGADAPEGAAAIARAADRSIGEIAAWTNSLPGCSGPR
jgi:cholesterol transport system auxiliary component